MTYIDTLGTFGKEVRAELFMSSIRIVQLPAGKRWFNFDEDGLEARFNRIQNCNTYWQPRNPSAIQETRNWIQ